jgi:hypothetical protein
MGLKHRVHDWSERALCWSHPQTPIRRHIRKRRDRLLGYVVESRQDVEHFRVHPLEGCWINRFSSTLVAALGTRFLYSIA